MLRAFRMGCRPGAAGRQGDAAIASVLRGAGAVVRLVLGRGRSGRALRALAGSGGAAGCRGIRSLPDAIGIVWPVTDATDALVDFEVGYTNPSSERMMACRSVRKWVRGCAR